MKTNTHRNIGAAVLVAMQLALVLVGMVSYAPTTSAHGKMECDMPTITGGNPPGEAYTNCNGHGWAELYGYCGASTVRVHGFFTHERKRLWISCAMAGTSGRITGVSVTYQAIQ